MNPFKVLNITKDATKKEVIQAVGLGMRSRQHSAQTIAQAQKMLLDPGSKACQQFLYCINLEYLKAGLIQQISARYEQEEQSSDSDKPTLNCLTIFDKDYDH
jgi:hypothetical protein